MPPGFSAQCSACGNPHRAEIDERLLRGEPTRSVSAWLLDQGERISHTSLARHKREHLSVAEAIAQRAAEAAPVLEQAVQAGLDDLAMHEAHARGDDALANASREWLLEMVQTRQRIPMTLVTTLKVASEEARQHAKAARDIRNGNGNEGDGAADERREEVLGAIARLAIGGGASTGMGPPDA